MRRGHGGGSSVDRYRKSEMGHWFLFKSTLPYVWPEGDWKVRGRLIGALSILCVSKIIELAVPFMLAKSVDAAVKVTTHPEKYGLSTLLGPIIGYAALRFTAAALSELKDMVFIPVAANTERMVALGVFTHLQKLSLSFHLKRKTGAVIRSVSRGASSFSTVTSIIFFRMMPVVLQVSVVCIYLAVQFPWYFAVLTFATIVSYFAFTLVTTEWRNKFRRTMNQKDNEYNQKAVDALLNFETVKYFNAEDHEQSRFNFSLREYQKASVLSSQSLSVLNIGQNFVISAGICIAMILAAKQVVSGDMTVGDFVLINQFILTLYTPLGFLGTLYRMIKQNLIDVENMFKLLNEGVDIVDKDDAGELHLSKGQIRFDNVTFSYDPSAPPILRNVSFTIEPGQSVAVVGKTGAGKSTLARLLYRFYDVQQGRVLVDGQDVRDVTQRSLRRHIAIVPQDCVLFNDTVGYNIAYGKVQNNTGDWKEEDIDYSLDEDIVDACQSAQIHDFVLRQKEGFDTMVGERGLRLSGGEKQRVAIARAVLKRPRIMVFDEATSSLDTHTEQEIQEALDRVAKGRTSLTIAHRLSTIVNADKIIVLKNGGIVEQGTHDELMTVEDGEYRRMFERQQQDAMLQERLQKLREEEASSVAGSDEEKGSPGLEHVAVTIKPAPVASPTAVEMQGMKTSKGKSKRKGGGKYQQLGGEDV